MYSVRSTLSQMATVLVALGAVLALAGCGPRAGGGTASAAPDTGIALDLPALVVDVDAEGRPHLSGIPLSELDDALEPGVLDVLTMDPETVQFLSEHDIQHLQVSNTPSGVLVLVNGEQLPSLAWDAEKLSATADLAAATLVDIPLLEELLHLSSRMGIGLVVRFPVAAGNQPLPILASGDESDEVPVRPEREDFLAAVARQPSITIPIYYESDGAWRVGDLTDTEWTNLTGLPWYALRLQTPVVEGAIAAGIEEIKLSTDADGIHVGVNGRELPFISWRNGEMEHALALAGQLGAWEDVSAAGFDDETIRTLLAAFLPIVQSADISIIVHFPARR